MRESKLRQEERGLVRRMIAGDEIAFERFCDDYIPAVYRYALRRLRGDEDLARDIVQTTVCKVVSKLASFRGEAALATWLCACCRNEIAGYYRRGSRRPLEVGLEIDEFPGEASLSPAAPDGPERVLLRKENAELVHQALDALPPHYGRALEWKYLENLSVKEIARRLELGPKAAESLLTRARQSFREGFARLATQVAPAQVAAPVSNSRAAVRP